MFPLAFVAGSPKCHWWGFISQNYVVWPIFFLMNVFIALNFLFLFPSESLLHNPRQSYTKVALDNWCHCRKMIFFVCVKHMHTCYISYRLVNPLIFHNLPWTHFGQPFHRWIIVCGSVLLLFIRKWEIKTNMSKVGFKGKNKKKKSFLRSVHYGLQCPS